MILILITNVFGDLIMIYITNMSSDRDLDLDHHFSWSINTLVTMTIGIGRMTNFW